MDERIMNMKKTFEKKGYKFDFVEDEKAANELMLSLVPINKSIAFGGSITLQELGLYEALTDSGVKVVWHWKKDYENPLSEAKGCNFYACSANGLSETGEIANIDGTGNRVASTAFGYEKVFIISGINKVTANAEEAKKRAREIAGPLNAKRLNVDTPCNVTGVCSDCNSPSRICKNFSLIERASAAFETHIIVVNKNLGY